MIDVHVYLSLVLIFYHIAQVQIYLESEFLNIFQFWLYNARQPSHRSIQTNDMMFASGEDLPTPCVRIPHALSCRSLDDSHLHHYATRPQIRAAYLHRATLPLPSTLHTLNPATAEQNAHPRSTRHAT